MHEHIRIKASKPVDSCSNYSKLQTLRIQVIKRSCPREHIKKRNFLSALDVDNIRRTMLTQKQKSIRRTRYQTVGSWTGFDGSVDFPGIFTPTWVAINLFCFPEWVSIFIYCFYINIPLVSKGARNSLLLFLTTSNSVPPYSCLTLMFCLRKPLHQSSIIYITLKQRHANFPQMSCPSFVFSSSYTNSLFVFHFASE